MSYNILEQEENSTYILQDINNEESLLINSTLYVKQILWPHQTLQLVGMDCNGWHTVCKSGMITSTTFYKVSCFIHTTIVIVMNVSHILSPSWP